MEVGKYKIAENHCQNGSIEVQLQKQGPRKMKMKAYIMRQILEFTAIVHGKYMA